MLENSFLRPPWAWLIPLGRLFFTPLIEVSHQSICAIENKSSKRMKIELHLYASFKSLLPEGSNGNTFIAEVDEGITVGELLRRMNIPAGAPKIVLLNGIHANGNEILKEGDRVGAFPPVAGG
jgi:molybdopterin converting factor small subunit